MSLENATIRPGTVYRLVCNSDRPTGELKLRNVEWGILFSVTGEHTVAQIGDAFSLPPAERDAAFARLLREGLLAERELTYSEYLRAAATVHDDEPGTLAHYLRAGAALGPLPPSVPAEADEPAPKPEPIRDVRESALPRPSPEDDVNVTRAVPTVRGGTAAVGFQPLSDPSPVPTLAAPEPARHLSMKAVMKFILDRAPDSNTGQLDVFRVLIRVDTRLLIRNGITTLRFQDDRLISDPELQQAITSNVEKILGLECPQTVYV